jgi:hypothetical protein
VAGGRAIRRYFRVERGGPGGDGGEANRRDFDGGEANRRDFDGGEANRRDLDGGEANHRARRCSMAPERGSHLDTVVTNTPGALGLGFDRRADPLSTAVASRVAGGPRRSLRHPYLLVCILAQGISRWRPRIHRRDSVPNDSHHCIK